MDLSRLETHTNPSIDVSLDFFEEPVLWLDWDCDSFVVFLTEVICVTEETRPLCFLWDQKETALHWIESRLYDLNL